MPDEPVLSDPMVACKVGPKSIVVVPRSICLDVLHGTEEPPPAPPPDRATLVQHLASRTDLTEEQKQLVLAEFDEAVAEPAPVEP